MTLVAVLTIGVSQAWAGVQTWDLTTNSYSSATGLLVTWSSTGATMTLAQGSGNAANGYLGNGTDQLRTRFYKSNVLTFTPASGYTIAKIMIKCTSGDYDDGFESSWTNASKTLDGEGVVIVTPTTGTSACSVILGNSTNPNRVTKVSVVYMTGAEVVVVDPDFNQLDDDHGYDFGETNNTTGTVTLSVFGYGLKTLTNDNLGNPFNYYVEVFPFDDDESNFSVNNTDDYFITTLSSTCTLRYTGLDRNGKYESHLWVDAYNNSTNEEMILYIPISVTYTAAPSAVADPTEWDFGDVAVGQTVTKEFTITTSNLESDLSVSMLTGGLGITVTPSSIDDDATTITLTVSFTPASAGYVEDMVQMEGTGVSEGIVITGTGVVAHAIHWMVNGVDWSLNPGAHGNPTVAVVNGAKITAMPTTPVAGTDGCGDKFMGWTTSPIDGSRGTAPTPCWNSLSCGSCFPAVNAETWYYAVFADEQP